MCLVPSKAIVIDFKNFKQAISFVTISQMRMLSQTFYHLIEYINLVLLGIIRNKLKHFLSHDELERKVLIQILSIVLTLKSFQGLVFSFFQP